MDEFIKELEHNQKINFEKGLENRINIDYVIERLKDIDPIRQYVKNEVIFNIESLINEFYMEADDEFKKLEALTDEDIEKIASNVYDLDWLWNIINENMNEAISDELYKYINNK